MPSDALSGSRFPGLSGRDIRERNSPLGVAVAASAGLHLLVFVLSGAAPGVHFALPWMPGGGSAITVIRLSHSPEPVAEYAVPGVLAIDRIDAGVPASDAAGSHSAPDAGPASDRSGRNAPRDSAPVALLPQGLYYPSSELDARPGIMVHINPEYPAQAMAERIEGSAVIRIYINERGGVDDVVAMSGTPPGLFEDSAVQAFRNARYSPGAKGGIPVKTFLTLEVNYQLPAPELRPR